MSSVPSKCSCDGGAPGDSRYCLAYPAGASQFAASETPTTVNPLGVKGIGEAGTIGATPAIQNAVTDALAHLGIRHIDMPATPQRVWTAINAAQKAGNQ